MKLLFYFSLVFALWYLYIVLRFVLKRVNLMWQIKRFSKENCLQCDITASAFLLPSNRCGTAVVVKTEKVCYNIRLFGLLRKNCAVHFWNKEMYSVEKFIPKMLLYDTPLGHRSVRRRKLGEWDNNANTEIPVLLYSSADSPLRIMQTKVNHIERLIAGDMLDGVLFVDWDYLYRYIEARL
mgnify:CR=1 FL=1